MHSSHFPAEVLAKGRLEVHPSLFLCHVVCLQHGAICLPMTYAFACFTIHFFCACCGCLSPYHAHKSAPGISSSAHLALIRRGIIAFAPKPGNAFRVLSPWHSAPMLVTRKRRTCAANSFWATSKSKRLLHPVQARLDTWAIHVLALCDAMRSTWFGTGQHCSCTSPLAKVRSTTSFAVHPFIS